MRSEWDRQLRDAYEDGRDDAERRDGEGTRCDLCGERIPWGALCVCAPDERGTRRYCPVCWEAEGDGIMEDAFSDLSASERMEALGIWEEILT